MLKYFQNKKKYIMITTRFYIVPFLLFEIKSQYASQNNSLNVNINCLYLNRYFLLYIDEK